MGTSQRVPEHDAFRMPLHLRFQQADSLRRASDALLPQGALQNQALIVRAGLEPLVANRYGDEWPPFRQRYIHLPQPRIFITDRYP